MSPSKKHHQPSQSLQDLQEDAAGPPCRCSRVGAISDQSFVPIASGASSTASNTGTALSSKKKNKNCQPKHLPPPPSSPPPPSLPLEMARSTQQYDGDRLDPGPLQQQQMKENRRLYAKQYRLRRKQFQQEKENPLV